ncbi:unnamed protein product [Penicillium salamii]|nr:unnamed protein product [Penicillium salamii]
MKRSADASLSGGSPRRQLRQDPVSCESCRRKKLKCDRNLPCSSCSVRKLDCSYGAYRGGARASLQPSQTEQRPAGTVPRDSSLNPRGMGTQIRGGNESTQTVDWLENIVMGPRVPSAVPATLRAELSHRDSENSPSQYLSPLEESRILRQDVFSQEHPATIHLGSSLPPHAEALRVFRYYCMYLDFQYHLIIPAQVEQHIEDIYRNDARRLPMNLAHVALLFSILASALYYEHLEDGSGHAEKVSRETTFLAGAALIQGNYLSYPTIEGLQATMIIGHQLSNMNLPPSVSSLFLHRSSVNQAISMRLHLIDSPQLVNERRSVQSDEPDVELKRRLWWDLAAYDWLIGFLSGPQEWTYSIQPQHMVVNEPLNIEDEDIGRVGQGQPMSTPTVMSYSLCRMKLAIVCRQVVDGTSQYHLRGQEVPYDITLALDRELQKILSEIPSYFRFDQDSQREYSQLYQDRPTFAWQRAMVQQGYHSRFCRLHRGYFVRGAKDPKYSYSHVVSLQSARKVLEIKRIMDEEGPVFTPHSSVVWSIMHHVFMAAAILLIDVCFNWDDILAEKRRSEVLDACRMLGQAQQSSPTARQGINAMMDILRKHWRHERHPASRGRENDLLTSSDVSQSSRQNIPTPVSISVASTAPHQAPDRPLALESTNLPSDPPLLEDLWAELLNDGAHAELDTPDWTVLLNELTNVTLPSDNSPQCNHLFNMSPKKNDLPYIRRYITTHNTEGEAVFISHAQVPDYLPSTPAGDDGEIALLYATTSDPASTDAEADVAMYDEFLHQPPGITVDEGTIFRLIDLRPGKAMPMHRTVSLDYGVIIEEEVDLVLDSGACRRMHRGDVSVQRGTAHSYRNRSHTEWCRMLFVFLPMQKLKIQGKELEAEVYDEGFDAESESPEAD